MKMELPTSANFAVILWLIVQKLTVYFFGGGSDRLDNRRDHYSSQLQVVRKYAKCNYVGWTFPPIIISKAE